MKTKNGKLETTQARACIATQRGREAASKEDYAGSQFYFVLFVRFVAPVQPQGSRPCLRQYSPKMSAAVGSRGGIARTTRVTFMKCL